MQKRYLDLLVAFACLNFTASAMAAKRGSGDENDGQPKKIYPYFYLPLEIGQGGIFINGKPQLYKASLQTQFNIRVDARGKLRMGPIGTLQYFSPDLELMGGGRISLMFLEKMNVGGVSAGLHIAAEAQVGRKDRKTVGGALIADGFGLLQLTARVGRDLKADFTFFELSVGADLRTWLDGSSKSNGTTTIKIHQNYFDLITVNMGVEASWLQKSEFAGQLEPLKRLLKLAQNLPDTTALVNLWESNNLSKLTHNMRSAVASANYRVQVEHTINVSVLNDSDSRRRFVLAIIQGWQMAILNE